MENGKIKQVLGPVVDVEFATGEMPAINTALRSTNELISGDEWNLVLEVAQHLGDGVCRTIAMDSTEGLVRGRPVKSTGHMIQTPVGPGVLGRNHQCHWRPDRRGGSGPCKGSVGNSPRSSSL